jgi:uncharacterized GH25 family protein
MCMMVGVTAATTPIAAHDFWMQPNRFWVEPGTVVPLILLVGHGENRQRSSITAERVVLFQARGIAGTVDRKPDLHLGMPTLDAAVSFASPGTYVITFATNTTPSELPALRFNDYAQAEGLTPILRQRAAKGQTNAPGRELYSRRAKVLLQVGRRSRTAQPQVTQPLGLGLEIVPLIDPYAPGKHDSFPVRVLFQGQPLAGAFVKLNNLHADAKPVETHLSDSAGMAVFKAPIAGEWQMNVVWSQPLANNRSAEFLTTFSSLTFGFTGMTTSR